MQQKRIISIVIDLPMEFPEDWDDDMIEWHLNEGTYCCDNLINELQNYSKENGCICNITNCKVRERQYELPEL